MTPAKENPGGRNLQRKTVEKSLQEKILEGFFLWPILSAPDPYEESLHLFSALEEVHLGESDHL
jgi:hypothetical protein